MNNRGRFRFSYFFSLAVSVATLFVLLQVAGWERVGKVLRDASIPLLLLALGGYAISWLFRTVRLGILTRRAGKTEMSLRLLFKLHVSGYALNDIFPAKLGDVATIGFLKMNGIQGGRSVAIMFQIRILDVLALVLVSTGTLVVFHEGFFSRWIWIGILISTMVAFFPMLVIWSESLHHLPEKLRVITENHKGKRIGFLFEKMRNIYYAYMDILRDKTLFFSSVFLSIVIWCFEGFTCLSVTMAMGAHPPFFLPFLAVAMANMGKAVPATPGGVGIYESIIVSIFVLAGFEVDVALAIAIVDHAIKKSFTLVLGLPATAGIIGSQSRQFGTFLKFRFPGNKFDA